MTLLPFRPPVNPDAVSAYLLHVAACCSQSSIARARGVNQSTIHRAVMAVEALREGAEWDAILTALQDAALQPGQPPALVLTDFRISAAARVVAGGDPVAPVLAAGPALLVRGATIYTHGLKDRAVIAGPDGQPHGHLPRAAVLAGLLAGWFSLFRPMGRLSVFRPAPAFLDDLRPLAGRLSVADLPVLGRLDLSPGCEAAAHRFALAYRQSPVAVDPIRGRMPRELFGPLELCVGRNVTIGQMERETGLPRGSGRPILTAALSVLAAIYTTGTGQ